MASDDNTCFLNVDLDIHASKPLDQLVDAFGKRVIVLHVGGNGRRYSAHVELAASGYGQSADRIVRGLVRLIENLPASSRAMWNAASVRRFNIGIQAEKRPPSFELPLKAATVEAIARTGADIVITVYAAGLPTVKFGSKRPSVARKT